MSKFYLLLWLRWAVRLSTSSILLAATLSSIITIFIYFFQGIVSINSEVFDALVDIFTFWFPISWSLALLIALFRTLKHIFNHCIDGFELKLLECNSTDIIEVIGYGDIVKTWRKWFMLIIWLVGSQMVFAVALTYMLTPYTGVFTWFNIYWLFGFVLSSGYLSFILLTSRCRRVKVIKC